MTFSRLLPIFLLIPLGATPTLAAPQTSAVKPMIDPRAVALLDRAVKAYANTQSLDQDFGATSRFNGKTFAGTGRWSYERPARARVEWNDGDGTQITLSDGETIYSRDNPYDYDAHPVQQTVPHDALISVAQSIPTAAGLPLSLMMAGTNPVAPALGLGWQSVTRVRSGALEGVSLVASPEGEEPRREWRVYFDSQTYLIARVENQTTFLPRPDAPQGLPPLLQTSVTTFAPRAPRATRAAFKWNPLPGAKPKPPRYDPRLRVGSEPFALTGQTLDGQKISLDSYKGKIVLLDFWATWCGPCLVELPGIKANYDKYRAQGFRVVGVSLDAEEADLRAFMAKRDLAWPQLFDGKIYDDANALRYGVTALPFSVLVGRDGKILEVEPRGWRLNLALQRAFGAGGS